MCSCYVEKIRLRLTRKAVAIQVALGMRRRQSDDLL